MPECAEVRRYVDQLTTEYGGQDLLNLEVIGGRFKKESVPGLDKVYFPLKNVSFNAKGKFIYWTFENTSRPHTIWKDFDSVGDESHFFITLGMSASFGKENKHSALKFTFSNGDIFYNDIRHFGTVKVNQTSSALKKKLASLGWDSLADPKIPDGFIKHLLRKKGMKTIAEVLLDQKLFAGCGNYLRSETLYQAKIHPNLLICQMTEIELSLICESLIELAHEAYNCGGATIATYSDLYGNVGTFFDKFKVYGKKTDPLGNKVLKMEAADGRTVHYVKEVQGLE